MIRIGALRQCHFRTAACECHYDLDLCCWSLGLSTSPPPFCFSQEYVASLSKQHELASTMTCDIVSKCSYEVASIVSHFTETSSLHWQRNEASVIESCSFFKNCSEFISFHRPLRFIMILFTVILSFAVLNNCDYVSTGTIVSFRHDSITNTFINRGHPASPSFESLEVAGIEDFGEAPWYVEPHCISQALPNPEPCSAQVQILTRALVSMSLVDCSQTLTVGLTAKDKTRSLSSHWCSRTYYQERHEIASHYGCCPGINIGERDSRYALVALSTWTRDRGVGLKVLEEITTDSYCLLFCGLELYSCRFCDCSLICQHSRSYVLSKEPVRLWDIVANSVRFECTSTSKPLIESDVTQNACCRIDCVTHKLELRELQLISPVDHLARIGKPGKIDFSVIPLGHSTCLHFDLTALAIQQLLILSLKCALHFVVDVSSRGTEYCIDDCTWVRRTEDCSHHYCIDCSFSCCIEIGVVIDKLDLAVYIGLVAHFEEIQNPEPVRLHSDCLPFFKQIARMMSWKTLARNITICLEIAMIQSMHIGIVRLFDINDISGNWSGRLQYLDRFGSDWHFSGSISEPLVRKPRFPILKTGTVDNTFITLDCCMQSCLQYLCLLPHEGTAHIDRLRSQLISVRLICDGAVSIGIGT